MDLNIDKNRCPVFSYYHTLGEDGHLEERGDFRHLVINNPIFQVAVYENLNADKLWISFSQNVGFGRDEIQEGFKNNYAKISENWQ